MPLNAQSDGDKFCSHVHNPENDNCPMSVSFVRRNERKKESGGAVHIVYFVKRRRKSVIPFGATNITKCKSQQFGGFTDPNLWMWLWWSVISLQRQFLAFNPDFNHTADQVDAWGKSSRAALTFKLQLCPHHPKGFSQELEFLFNFLNLFFCDHLFSLWNLCCGTFFTF